MLLNSSQIAIIEKCHIDKGAPNYQEILIELTDDVASDVEKLITKNKDLDFESALKISLDRYSKSILRQLGREKEGAIMRNYAKLEWQMIKTWFSWPKIVLTLALTLVFSWALSAAFDFGKPVSIIVYFTLLFLPMIPVLLQAWKRRQFNRSLSRKVLALKIGINSLGVMGILPTLLYLPQLLAEEFFNLRLMAFSYYWYYQAFLLVIIWISVFAIAPILEEKSREQAQELVGLSNG